MIEKSQWTAAHPKVSIGSLEQDAWVEMLAQHSVAS